MTHSKIFTRADGTEYEIFTKASYDADKQLLYYQTYIELKLRDNGRMRLKGFSCVTPAEILEVQMELWEMIKPQLMEKQDEN